MKTITLPQDTTLVEAGTVAAQQGCVLRADNGRVYMKRSQASLNSAMRAIDQGRFEHALGHVTESRKHFEAYIELGGNHV